MKLKWLLLMVIILILIGNYFSNGAIIRMVFPFYEDNKATILCSLGGLLFNPVATKIGNIFIPYPSGDDALFGVLGTSVVIFLTRGKILSGSWKKKIFVIVALWLIFWFAFKYFGYFLILQSGMPVEQCVEYISIGGMVVPYDTFNILFYIGALMAVIALAKLIWKYREK